MKTFILASCLFFSCISLSWAQSSQCESQLNQCKKNELQSAIKSQSQIANQMMAMQTAKTKIMKLNELIKAHEVKLDEICDVVAYWLDSGTKGQSQDGVYEGLALLSFQAIYEMAGCETLDENKSGINIIRNFRPD